MEQGRVPEAGDRAVADRNPAIVSTPRVSRARYRAPGPRFPLWLTVTISIACVAVLLNTSLVPDPASLAGGNSGFRTASSSPSPPGSLGYPYAISAGLFPAPSTLVTLGRTSLVRLVSLDTALSSFGLLNVSGNSSGPDSLWYSIGSYSPLAAEAIVKALPCVSGSISGGDCLATPTVPVLWSSPAQVTSGPGVITADALAVQGYDVYAAATTSGSTSLYLSTNGGATWSAFATSLGGTVEGLSLSSTTLVAVTLEGFAFTSYSYSLGGTFLGESLPLTLAGSGITSVNGASVAETHVGTSPSFVIVTGVAGPNEIEAATSSNGIGYSAFAPIATFNSTVPPAPLSSVGGTQLYPSGGTPGQVTLAAIGSGMVLLYTTRVDGEVTASSMASAVGGSSWQGPYRIGSGPGTVEDPQLSPSLAGTVYATWWNSANGTGTAVEAILAPNGDVLEAPASIPGSSVSGVSPVGGPAIAVDAFQRPLIVWPATQLGSPTEGLLAYSGGFLYPSTAAGEVQQIITDPLVQADFSSGAPGSPPQQTLSTSVSGSVSSIDANLTNASTSTGTGQESSYCNAQNDTVLSLYASVTRIPLSYGNSESTVCASFTFAELHPTKSYVAPLLGPTAPNTYLAVYTDWVLEATGVEVTASPLLATSSAVQPPQDGVSFSPQPFAPLSRVSGSATVQGKTETVTVTPTVFSPTALQLSASSTPIPKYWSNTTVECGIGLKKTGFAIEEYYTYPSGTSVAVSLNNGTEGSFDGTSSFVSTVYITNQTPSFKSSTHQYWTAKFSVTYSETETITVSGTGCTVKAGTYSISPASPSSLGPISMNGTFWTELTIWPSVGGSAFVTADTSNNELTVSWINTADATDTLSLVNDTTGIDAQSWSYGYSASPRTQSSAPPGTMGNTYTVTLGATSRAGGWTSQERPALNANGPYNNSHETATDTCTFTMNPSSESLVAGSGSITNVTSTSATVSWNATGTSAGPGFVTYYAVGTGVNLTDDQVNFTTGQIWLGNHGGSEPSYQYVAQLHGLLPWMSYSVTYGIASYPVGGAGGCVTDVSTSSLPQFLTNYTVPIWEQDRPYDSITHTGGGATIGWNLPAWFLAKNPTWVSGSLNYTYNGTSVGVPLSPSMVSSPSSAGFEITLPLPQPGISYMVNLSLTYEIGTTSYHTYSPYLSFVYLKDSSGDGLTNLEKIDGWMVTYQDAGGAWVGQPFSANPALYATNGLVNDYLEKEFGLNPNTVDTAGSHMLDTWNLTFPLASSACPAGFECWWKNSSNPFSYNATPAGLNPGGTPLATNATSTASWHGTAGTLQDNAPYDAEVLWSGGAIGVLQSLIRNEGVGWVRGVVMDGYSNASGHHWTLTVWGKLSWGANPLAASTPNDGLADGQRVNPLTDVGLEFDHVYVSAGGFQTDAYAAKVSYTYRAANSQIRSVTNYTSNATPAGIPSMVSNYSVTLPVGQAAQNQSIEISAVVSVVDSNGSHTLVALPIEGTNTSVNVSFDLLSGAYSVSGSSSPLNVQGQNSYSDANISGNFQEVPLEVKAPTWLWLPDTNSTTNGLPLGLERYTGEQSFALVAVDASSSYASDPIPLPWGGDAPALTLSPGMNSFLIPREQFLASPFGQAILLGRNTSYNSTSGAAPLLGPAEQSLISGFGSTNPMVNLGAYWQNRAIANTSAGPLLSTAESGTPLVVNSQYNPLVVQVLGAPNATASNTGGLPSNPSVYTSVGDPSAIQAIVTLNVTNVSALDLLLAALLDNTTGGPNAVNGTFQPVASYLPSLGLEPVVLDALANRVYASKGLFGPPSTPLPTNYTSSFWGEFWNAVSSVVTNPLGTIESLAGVVWNEATAAYAYLYYLRTEGLALGGEIVARTVAAAEHVGQEIASELSAFLQWLWQRISSFFTAAASALTTSFNNVLSSWRSDVYAASNFTLLAYEGQNVSQNTHLAVTEWSAVLLWPALAAIAIGLAVDILLDLTATFAIGPSVLVAFLVPILLNLLSSSLGSSGSTTWLGTLLAELQTGVALTLEGFDAAAQYVFNATQHPLTSTQATGFIAPSVPGDAWSLLALILGLVAASGAGAAAYLTAGLPPENPAGLTIYPEGGGQIASAAQSAAIAMIAAIFTVLLLALEYVVSAGAPQSGPVADAAVVGELVLAVLAVIAGGFALGYGWMGIGTPAATYPSGVAVGFGAGGILFGIKDIEVLASNGLPS